MTPFEEELKKALARREPSAGFTERLLARVKEQEQTRAQPWWKRMFNAPPRMAWAAGPVCALVLLASGTAVYREHERAVQGERAKQQLLLALRITGDKLQATQRQLREVETEK